MTASKLFGITVFHNMFEMISTCSEFTLKEVPTELDEEPENNKFSTPDGESVYQLYPEAFLLLNKRQNLVSLDNPEDGLLIPLTMDLDHVLVPSRHTGISNSGFDIALFRIPDDWLPKVLAYMDQHANDSRLDTKGQI